MPGVSEEQIAAARQMTAIEFLQRYRPGELVKAESRGEFQLRAHDSFKINEETSFWHWKSRDIGGKTALDYLIKVEGVMSHTDAAEGCYIYGKTSSLQKTGCWLYFVSRLYPTSRIQRRRILESFPKFNLRRIDCT